MPFVLIVIGVILLVTAIQGTTGTLASMLAQDTFGAGGFLYWFVAILIIGAVGYIPKLKTASDLMLLLVLMVLLLSQKGFAKQFVAALGQVNPATATTTGTAAGTASSTPTNPAAGSGQIGTQAQQNLAMSQPNTATGSSSSSDYVDIGSFDTPGSATDVDVGSF